MTGEKISADVAVFYPIASAKNMLRTRLEDKRWGWLSKRWAWVMPLLELSNQGFQLAMQRFPFPEEEGKKNLVAASIDCGNEAKPAKGAIRYFIVLQNLLNKFRGRQKL